MDWAVLLVLQWATSCCGLASVRHSRWAHVNIGNGLNLNTTPTASSLLRSMARLECLFQQRACQVVLTTAQTCLCMTSSGEFRYELKATEMRVRVYYLNMPYTKTNTINKILEWKRRNEGRFQTPPDVGVRRLYETLVSRSKTSTRRSTAITTAYAMATTTGRYSPQSTGVPLPHENTISQPTEETLETTNLRSGFREKPPTSEPTTNMPGCLKNLCCSCDSLSVKMDSAQLYFFNPATNTALIVILF